MMRELIKKRSKKFKKQWKKFFMEKKGDVGQNLNPHTGSEAEKV